MVLRQESSRAAADRFGAALDDRLRVLTPDDVPVIVSHGRIMASWLASLTDTEAWEIWTALRLPDLLDVDLDAGTFLSVDIPLA